MIAFPDPEDGSKAVALELVEPNAAANKAPGSIPSSHISLRDVTLNAKTYVLVVSIMAEIGILSV
jgi:hypothetical protein